MKKKRIIRIALLVPIFIVIMIIMLITANYFGLLPRSVYYGKHFGIETIKSEIDFNNNGIDDYTDIMLGARKDAENHPTYDSRYWSSGYPPEDIGVCTDVVWRAFKNAGYSLRDMVDTDIQNRPESYPNITTRDYNIDFRRVINLHVFFEKYAVSLSTDINEIECWQPGDIVIFDDDQHIGIVSDKRNKEGKTFIIHNGGQSKREEDLFSRTESEVTAHYRFDASLIPKEVLVAFSERDEQ